MVEDTNWSEGCLSHEHSGGPLGWSKWQETPGTTQSSLERLHIYSILSDLGTDCWGEGCLDYFAGPAAATTRPDPGLRSGKRMNGWTDVLVNRHVLRHVEGAIHQMYWLPREIIWLYSLLQYFHQLVTNFAISRGRRVGTWIYHSFFQGLAPTAGNKVTENWFFQT